MVQKLSAYNLAQNNNCGLITCSICGGIKRAITTGRKAKGHHWYWADEISEDSQR